MMNSMEIFHSFSEITQLEKGAVYALPTDTVYGLSCALDDIDAVQEIRRMKERDSQKPMIVLVSTMRDLEKCGIRPSEQHIDFLKRIWPGPVSVVFAQAQPQHAHLAYNDTLAVRMPLREDLRAFIARVGPIVSTSANLSGEKPATTLEEVQTLFGENLKGVVDTGECNNPPSTVVQILR